MYDTPFEQAAHLAEVRHIDNARGRYNVPNVGLFLWRLQSYLLRDVSARTGRRQALHVRSAGP